MSKKHVIQYSSARPTRMNYCNFGNYKDKTGKNRDYVDINGVKQEKGFITTKPNVRLDVTLEHEKLVDDFLKDHPLIRTGKWVRKDLQVQEYEETNKILLTAEAVNLASKLNLSETRDLARLMNISLAFDDTVLKGKIVSSANTNPDHFLDMYNDEDKDHKVFIKKALEQKIINFDNRAFRYNGEAIGVSEERVITWLLDNKDIYAVMKLEVNGQNVKELKEEVLNDANTSKS